MYTNYQISDETFDTTAWINKYPFLRIKDASCTYYEENTDEVCWLNDIPLGWVKAFGEDMCNELLEVLGEHVDDFIIVQLKEKFAEMRLYWDWADKDYSAPECDRLNQLTNMIELIISKYAAISRQTCYICGAQNARISNGTWIIPICTECEKSRH